MVLIRSSLKQEWFFFWGYLSMYQSPVVAITSNHKLRGLTQHRFIILQFPWWLRDVAQWYSAWAECMRSRYPTWTSVAKAVVLDGSISSGSSKERGSSFPQLLKADSFLNLWRLSIFRAHGSGWVLFSHYLLPVLTFTSFSLLFRVHALALGPLPSSPHLGTAWTLCSPCPVSHKRAMGPGN